MSSNVEYPIRVNFATVQELQLIPQIGPKVACALIELRESNGNLTLETLQTFLRTKFDAETLEFLDFTRNVCLPVAPAQYGLEEEEEPGVEERQRPVSPARSEYKDPFDVVPSEDIEQKPPIFEMWKNFRKQFSPMMVDQKLPLHTDKGESYHERPIPVSSIQRVEEYKVLRPAKFAKELHRRSAKKEGKVGKLEKSKHHKKSAKHKKGRRHSSSSSSSSSGGSSEKERGVGKSEKKHSKAGKHKKKVQSDSSSSSSSSSEEHDYAEKGAKPKKKLKKRMPRDDSSSSPGSSDSSSSSTDSDDEFNIRAKHRHHKKSKKKQMRGAALLRLLPKNLSYDGKTNWLAFKQKFTRYATACEWTSSECLNCLCWCLTDKAADFYAILMERNEHLTYRRLMDRLEKRFGVKELAETAHARFQQATQAPGESLEDWADRILTLATKAFKTLPEHYSNKQAVVRFCEGLLDREAGLRVGMDKPATIEQAINNIRWYQHLHQSVYGKSSKRDQKKQEEGFVKAVQETRIQSESSDGQSSSRISALEDAMTKLQKSFDAMSSKMTQQQQQQKKQGGQMSSYKRPGTLKGACYRCGEVGHFRRDCPKNWGRQESGQQNLNAKGPGPKADPRPTNK